MSSTPDSLYDIEDAASKKRGRAQSVEPTPAPKNENESEKPPTVSAPKKTKRDEEGQQTNNNNKNHSVSTIRKNMKDMSTTDKSADHLDDAMTGHSQESNYDGEDETDHAMGTINEEGSDVQSLDHDSGIKDSGSGSLHSETKPDANHIDTTNTTTTTNSANGLNGNNANHAFSRFGIKSNGDSDDWSEFADDNEKIADHKSSKDSTPPDTGNDKPKYTFGSSSGFGTKGWGSAHQTTPNTPKTTAFTGLSGFCLSSTPSATSSVAATTSGFGAFATTQSTTTKSTPSAFGAFASAPTTSPFALAAATNNASNALSSLPKVSPSSVATVLSPGDSAGSVEGQDNDTDDQQENNQDEHTFGEGSKIKIPGVKPMEVKTGEEDENTVYQTKAKLLILDSTTNNWKERGSGTLRINVKESEAAVEEKTSTQARLVMRTDSVYRLILNLLLFSEMKAFIMQDRFVRFAGFESETKEDGSVGTKLVNYALKVANPFAAQELHYQITSRIPSKSN